jgi:hypothetical protein
MMPEPAFPATWQCNKRKTAAHALPAKRARRAVKHKPTTVSQIQHAIEGYMVDAPEHADDVVQCSVDVVRELSLADMLCAPPAAAAHRVPVVSRAYEERYMRECKHKDEQQCVSGVKCECMLIDSSKAFVGVQFQLPDVASSAAGMCVLCLRKTTTLLFYQTIYNGERIDAVIQKHGNVCNVAGEYHPSAMLCCPVNGPLHCMPLPIVAHQRNLYSVQVVGGVKHVRQHGVYMEDFG